jgi:prepilin-type N-terminal cleavage/methylation domain-containing protein
MLRNEKGFTLLEIIASMAILATAILTLVQMFSGSLKQGVQADRYLTGVYLAQSKLSQLELENFNAETSGLFEKNLEGAFENQEGYYWQSQILPYESSLDNQESRIQVRKIVLRVYWNDKGQEKEVQLVTLKTLGETHSATPTQLGSSSQAISPTLKAPDRPKIKNLNPSGSP